MNEKTLTITRDELKALIADEVSELYRFWECA